MKSILDKDFRYTSAAGTNLKATFARVRRQLAEDAKREAATLAEAEEKVTKIKGKK